MPRSLLVRHKEQPSAVIAEPTLDDVNALAQLFDAYRRFYGCAGDEDAARRYIRNRFVIGPTRFFIERDGEAVRGFVHLLPSFDTLAMGPIWILEDLFVDTGARCLGIGAALLTHAERFAIGSGASRLMLSTAHTNISAQRLYERLGWELDREFRYYHKMC